jgi:hypothetical protein
MCSADFNFAAGFNSQQHGGAQTPPRHANRPFCSRGHLGSRIRLPETHLLRDTQRQHVGRRAKDSVYSVAFHPSQISTVQACSRPASLAIWLGIVKWDSGLLYSNLTRSHRRCASHCELCPPTINFGGAGIFAQVAANRGDSRHLCSREPNVE